MAQYSLEFHQKHLNWLDLLVHLSVTPHKRQPADIDTKNVSYPNSEQAIY